MKEVSHREQRNEREPDGGMLTERDKKKRWCMRMALEGKNMFKDRKEESNEMPCSTVYI